MNKLRKCLFIVCALPLVILLFPFVAIMQPRYTPWEQ